MSPAEENKKKSFWRPAAIALIAVAAVVVIAVVVFYSIDWGAYLDKHIAEIMMADTGAPTQTPEGVGLSYKDIVITTADGMNLAGWFIPNPKSNATVIFCRGAKGNIGFWLDMIKRLSEMGYNVLAFDYRGTGLSGGEPSFLAVPKDIAAAVQYAKKNLDAAAARVGIFGVSIGAAMGITAAASLDDVDAIIADSPFTSMVDMAPVVIRKHAPQLESKIPGDDQISGQADPIKCVQDVSPKPLFIIANEKDRLTRAEMSMELFSKAREPKFLWVAPGTPHIGAKDVFATEYWAKVADFFDHWLAREMRPEFTIAQKSEPMDDGRFEVKMRLSNTGLPVDDDIPVAVIAETESGAVQKNIYFPKTRTLEFMTDSKPLHFRVMQFFHVEPKGDTWELLPG